MKDMINERIKRLAMAHECLTEMSENILELENIQFRIEKSAYETINSCDKSLCIAKEGNRLITDWKEKNAGAFEKTSDTNGSLDLINDLDILLTKMIDIAYRANETTHNMEIDIAAQKDLEENIKNSMSVISASINQAAACAELVMTLDL